MGLTEKKVFNIDQGEDKVLVVHLFDQDADDVVDLTDADEVIARFTNDDGTILEKKLTTGGVAIESVPGAKVRVILSEADTAALLVGERQTFEVEAQVDGLTTIVKFERALTVKAAIA